MFSLSRSCSAGVVLLMAAALGGQPRFDAVSIKPNRSGSDGTTVNTFPGGRFAANNITLRSLVESAFGVRDFQVIGGPGWADKDAWDISAKIADGNNVEGDALRPVLQAMLADRFKLVFHRETRQLPVYSLTVEKSGSKLKPHTGSSPPSGRTLVSGGKATMSATAAPIQPLAENLATAVGRPVIDNTGLKSLYDFTLEWIPDQAVDSSGPSIFTAVREQLGLRLEASKGPVEVIVIDSAARASEN